MCFVYPGVFASFGVEMARWREVTSWRRASRLANALRALGRGDSGVPDAE